jgi:CheY-like chemotaxis protein
VDEACAYAMADILIVEDNPDIVEILEFILTTEGHQVRSVADGEAGLRELTEPFPDLVIMDVEMPILDGPGMVYRMLLEDLGRESIPIILISATASLPEIARRVGVPYHLAKPFDPNELLSMVARALEERLAPSPPG